MTQFAAPAPASGGLDLPDVNGHLLLITPSSLEKGISTTFGPKNAIRADVIDLDTGESHADTLLFPLVLVGQLKSRIGQQVLGRLAQGTAKPGQKPPWILGEFTPEDAAKASEYVAKAAVSGIAAPDSPPF